MTEKKNLITSKKKKIGGKYSLYLFPVIMNIKNI